MPSPVTHLQVAAAPPENRAPAQVGGALRTPTSFGDYGVPEEMVGQGFDPHSLFSSPRALELRFRASYFHCQQHDAKRYDWDGNATGPVIRTTQPFLGSSQPSQFIPLRLRRPAVPYRIGRRIVFGFTDFLFGQGRWPQMRSKDPKTQAAAEALVVAGEIASRCIQARNFGGACGTAGLSWRFVDGKPVVRAHRGQNIHIVSWQDEDACLPAHVVELKQQSRFAIDPDDGVLKPTVFWVRRDWTQQADVVFKPARMETDQPLQWEVDGEASCVHGDGFCHFVWVQNRPSEDDSEDGVDDYATTYEQQDGLDVLNSTNYRGVNLNLDPTLKVKVPDPDAYEEGFKVIKKGSDNALVLRGVGADADYLQLSDTEIGEKTIGLQRGQIYEVAGFVTPDPDKVAAAASSGEAQRMLFAPMIASTDMLRMTWGPAVRMLVNQMLRSWRILLETPVQVPRPANDIEVVDDATGESIEQEPGEVEYDEYPQDLDLPPRQVSQRGPDGEEQVSEESHHPGEGEVDVEFGPYFKPSGDEKQKIVTTVGAATGGKPVLSQRTGVELAANLLDRDADEEWQAVQAEALESRQNEADMLDPQQRGGQGPDADPNAIQIAPTDQVKVLSVNEVRAVLKQGPLLRSDGSPDPDGDLSVSAYDAKMAAQQQVEGDVEGKQNVGLPAVAPEPKAPPVPEAADDELPSPPLPGLGE